MQNKYLSIILFTSPSPFPFSFRLALERESRKYNTQIEFIFIFISPFFMVDAFPLFMTINKCFSFSCHTAARLRVCKCRLFRILFQLDAGASEQKELFFRLSLHKSLQSHVIFSS